MAQRDPLSFRHRQVVQDLIAVARRADEAALRSLAEAVPGMRLDVAGQHRALVEVLAGDGTVPAEVADDLLPGLLLSATLPRLDELAFECATAILLADRLQGGSGSDTLEWHWDAFADHYRAADAAVRAALTQGILLCRDLGLMGMDAAPAGHDLVTRDAAMVAQALGDLARPCLRDEIRPVPDPESRGALGPSEAGSPPDRWPDLREAVTRADTEARAFLPCVALLALNALQDAEANRSLARLWPAVADALLSRRPESDAVLAGLRHLFEAGSEMPAGWVVPPGAPLLPWDPVA